jgi:glycosyltransferase involved in cell wall biosynthesis
MPVKVALVISHPIQHFCVFYRALAAVETLDLEVVFCSDLGVRRYFDRNMGVEIAWKADLLSGYSHRFLPEGPTIQGTRFWEINNPSLDSNLNEVAPDVVVVAGYAQATMLRAIVWARRHGVPVLMAGDSELLHHRPWYRRALKHFVLRPLLSQIAGFLTVGENNEAYLRHYGVPADRMFRSPFTIDEASFAAVRAERSSVRDAFRRRHQLPADAFVVLFVGKLIAHKRPGDLVQALVRLRADGAPEGPVWLALAGDGPLRGDLERAAAGLNCRFLGFLNLDELPAAYVAADVFALPSEREPHSLAVQEAVFVGLPVVLSDRVGTTGPSDVSRAGINALVYPCGDVPALAAALDALVRDPARLAAMGRASLQVSGEVGLAQSVAGFCAAVTAVNARRRHRFQAAHRHRSG